MAWRSTVMRPIGCVPLFALLLVPQNPVDSAGQHVMGPASASVLPISVASPNAAIRLELSARSKNRLSYRITMNDRPVVELSRAGIIVAGVNLGDGVSLTGIETARHDGRYRTRGVHSMAVDRYNGATVGLVHEPTGT